VFMSIEGVRTLRRRTSPQTGDDVQRDAFERHQYQKTLYAIVESPDKLVLIDEIHKSRNEGSRRRH
jgi:hypothetical protein